MAIVDYNFDLPQSYQAPSFAPTNPETQPTLIGAVWRQENAIANYVELVQRPKFEPQENFNLEARLRENADYELNPEAFYDIQSDEEFEYVMNKVRQEVRDNQVIASHGAGGIAAAMVSGVLSPTILLPAGQLKAGRSLLSSVARVSGWAMAGATIDEGILYVNQENRTGAEVMLNVSSAGVLGGLIGGIAHKATPDMVQRFEDSARAPEENQVYQSYFPESTLSAARATSEEPVEVGKLLGIGENVRSRTFLGPLFTNMQQSASNTARWFQAQLSTAGMYTEGTRKGIAPAVGGEIAELVKFHYGRLASVKTEEKALWHDYRKSTPHRDRLRREQFDEVVGRSVAGQPSNIPQAEEMAKIYREQIYLPMYREMKAAGHPLFQNITEADAMKYHPLVVKQGLLEQDKTGLIEIFREYFSEELMNKFRKAADLTEESLAKQEEMLSDISLKPEEIGGRLGELEAEMKNLPAQFPDVREVAEEIRSLRAQAREGVTRAEAKALRAEANRLSDENKERLKPFTRAESRLKSRFRNIAKTTAGLKSAQAKIFRRIEKLEQMQRDTLLAASRRITKLRKKLETVEPRAEEITKIKEQLEKSYTTWLKQEEQLDELREIPAGFKELVNDDVRPTERISIAEAAQKQREAQIEELQSRLDEVGDDPQELAEVLEATLQDVVQRTIDLNAKRTLRLEKLQERAKTFDPQRALDRQAEIAQNIANIQQRLFDKLGGDQLGGELTVRATPQTLSGRQPAVKDGFIRLWRAAGTEGEFVTTRPKGDDLEFIDVKADSPEGKAGRSHGSVSRPTFLAANKESRLGKVDFSKAADDIAHNIYNKMTGQGKAIPALSMVGERGSLRERTLHIDPFREWSNGKRYADYIEWNAERASRRYLRETSADVELYKRFGTTNPLHEQSNVVQKIEKEFREAEEIVRQKGLPQAKQEHEIRKLQALKKEIMQNFAAQIDRLRHIRGVPEDPNSIPFRGGRMLSNLNVLRLMGGAVVASLPEIGGIVVRHGMLNVFRRSIVPMITDFKKFKMSAREANYAGANVELALHSRAGALYDLMDEVEFGTRFERGTQWATNNFGMVTLLTQYTAGLKAMDTALVNARLTKAIEDMANGKINKRDIAYLAANGIDELGARRIYAEITAGGGNKFNGAWLPNTMDWQDQQLARGYLAALSRQVDSEVVTPGIERPLWMDGSMLGRLVAQFRSFTFSSTQRMLIAGYQEARLGNQLPVLQGVVTLFGMGMLSYYLYAISRGGKTAEEMRNAPIEKWLVEGTSRSGILGVLAELHNFAENVPATQPYATLGTGRTSRSAFANPIERILGPSMGALKDVQNIVSTFNDPNGGTAGSVRRLLPTQNVSYFAWLFNLAEDTAENFMGVR